MFDTLPAVKTSERLVRFAVVVLVSVLLFGGLYMVVQHLE
jgi:hypothetical protein